MAVEIKIQFNGKVLTFPINPEELNLSRSADNENINVLGIGPATRKGMPGLYELEIESFFPGEKSYFYTGVNPKTCVDFIDTIWKTENRNNNVAKIITTGLLKNLDMYFVIEDFDWDYKAGEEEDIYYTLKIKEYKPYGVKLIPIELVNNSKTMISTSSQSRTSSTATDTSKQNTYKVQQGDCLWNIAKAASGNGNNWKQLYNLNKKVIGSNPNLIKPGQILILPDGWKGSFKVSKLTGSSGNKTVKSTSTSKKTSTGSSSGIKQGPVQLNTKDTTYTRSTKSATQLLAESKIVKIVTNPTTKTVTKFSAGGGAGGGSGKVGGR